MKKTTTAALLIALALLVIIGLVAVLRIATSHTANDAALRIYLPSDTDYTALLDTLDANGIGTSTALRLMAKATKLDKNVRAGSYVVQPQMKNIALVRKLRNGMQDPLRLTIGKYRLPQQLNEYLNAKLMHDDFNITLDSFHLILRDTYEFYWTVTPEQFMQRMAKEYDSFWKMESEKWIVDSSAAESSHLAHRDAIILASIVEEETNYGPEKPLVASVYLNRLRRGMPLQADPTVKYAVGDFTLRRILNRHLATESHFNTYLHTGLPPAPICLPSKATIEAVLNAPQTDFLYFCASDKMDGTHRFASSLDEHNRNAQRFHQALNNLGVK